MTKHLMGCGYPAHGCSCDVIRRIAARHPLIDLETRSVRPLPEPWKPTEAQMLEAAGITRSATASCDVCHGSGENWWDRLWPESPCRICGGSGLIYAESGLPAPRPPIAPGLLLEDDEARVYVSRGVLRIVARWAVGLGMIVTGAAVMFAEGQMQAQPGPGFAVGLALIVGAAFVVAGR